MTVTVRQPDSEHAFDPALESPPSAAVESFEFSKRACEVLGILNDVFDGWEPTKRLATEV